MSEKETEGKRNTLSDKLIDNVISLVEVYLNLLKLEIKNGASATLSILIIIVAGISLLTFATMLLSISLAWFISDFFEVSKWFSLMLVGFLYILMFIILIALRKPLKRKIDALIDELIEDQIENNGKN